MAVDGASERDKEAVAEPADVRDLLDQYEHILGWLQGRRREDGTPILGSDGKPVTLNEMDRGIQAEVRVQQQENFRGKRYSTSDQGIPVDLISATHDSLERVALALADLRLDLHYDLRSNRHSVVGEDKHRIAHLSEQEQLMLVHRLDNVRRGTPPLALVAGLTPEQARERRLTSHAVITAPESAMASMPVLHQDIGR